MNRGTLSKLQLALREQFPLWVLSASVMVLCSLDQCTRGPSITALVIANLDALF
ncbi:MAG TPA: hypothetical protein VHA82_08885 [Ramlibacter sp.]|uniref:hypothetical protein n=1 Tax=Ramlibacter sp. TaxID=1917967 RepID=UPI002B7EB4E6|nr:hypothetical protein [Ramlibacter sp.]HVZ43911.1 hypothetical protein [Ramlibacter sp.]